MLPVTCVVNDYLLYDVCLIFFFFKENTAKQTLED